MVCIYNPGLSFFFLHLLGVFFFSVSGELYTRRGTKANGDWCIRGRVSRYCRIIHNDLMT